LPEKNGKLPVRQIEITEGIPCKIEIEFGQKYALRVKKQGFIFERPENPGLLKP